MQWKIIGTLFFPENMFNKKQQNSGIFLLQETNIHC